MKLCTSQPKPKKIKKNSPRKKFLIFPETELSSSNIKTILIFSRKKVFLIFSQNKALLIYAEMEPCTFQPGLKK